MPCGRTQYLEVYLGAHLFGFRVKSTAIVLNSVLHFLNPVVVRRQSGRCFEAQFPQ